MISTLPRMSTKVCQGSCVLSILVMGLFFKTVCFFMARSYEAQNHQICINTPLLHNKLLQNLATENNSKHISSHILPVGQNLETVQETSGFRLRVSPEAAAKMSAWAVVI